MRFEKHLYQNYYPGLFYIFLEAQSKTMTYPGISWMELNKMITNCDIFVENFGESEIDRIYEENVTAISLVLEKEKVKVEYDPGEHKLNYLIMSVKNLVPFNELKTSN